MTDEDNRQHRSSESLDAVGWLPRTTPPVGSIGYTGAIVSPPRTSSKCLWFRYWRRVART